MFDLFSWIMKAKGYPLQQAAEALKQIQSLSADAFCDWQTKAAWAIAKHHYRYNDLYKNKVGKTFPTRWEDLPIITKKDLQQPLTTTISKSISLKDCYVGSTSGSSGVPFFFAKDKYAHAMTWALIADRYSWYGLTGKDLQARFYGIPHEPFANAKERIKDKAMNRFRFSVFDLSDTTLAGHVETFSRKPFAYLYGYTNALVLFARYLIRNNIVLKDVCPSIKLCISTSEVATAEDHQLLQQAFGVPHVREYGVSETCLMAFGHPSGKWLLTEETLYNEVTGSGNLLSTSLFNKAFPMVRYEVGDTVTLKPGIAEGKYRMLESLGGRTNDTIKLPSGKVAAGLTFYYISRSILEQTDCLKEFIIRQTAIDTFVFDIVSNRDLTEAETTEIKNKATLYLEPSLKIVINRVPFIARTEAGKLKHFFSELG